MMDTPFQKIEISPGKETSYTKFKLPEKFDLECGLLFVICYQER